MGKSNKKRKETDPAKCEGFKDFMDGYCAAFEDLSDGAWECACMEGVEAYNHGYQTNIDPHEGWLYWSWRNRK